MPTATTNTGEPILRASEVHKTYRLGRVRVPVLRGATLEVRRGECVAILGASGSGKSTLLHLLGALDTPDPRTPAHPGGIDFEGRPLADLSARARNHYRARRVGFVFQFYHLLPELSVMDNVRIASMVALGLRYRASARAVTTRATGLLTTMGLGHRLNHRPAELSGGERQRVAIARALLNGPDLLMADEPTGNLDRATGDAILDALAELRARDAQTLVMVTHDPAVAARADRIVHLVDGRVAPGAPGSLAPAEPARAAPTRA